MIISRRSSPSHRFFEISRALLIPRRFSSSPMRPLSVDDLNPAILKVQYAVRGELAIKSEEHRETLKAGNHALPFTKVISSNIGNPQQKGLDQPPLTFTRQVGCLGAIVKEKS
jgi:alanine transaminase